MTVTPKNWLKENSRQWRLTSKGERRKEQTGTLWEVLPVPPGCSFLSYEDWRKIHLQKIVIVTIIINNK